MNDNNKLFTIQKQMSALQKAAYCWRQYKKAMFFGNLDDAMYWQEENLTAVKEYGKQCKQEE